MRVVIVGGGIIGASIAWNLAQRGVRSTVIEAGPVAGAATGRGFGWINASFHLDPAHYRLRVAAMEAWRRVENALGREAVSWPGCLNWELEGAALEAEHDKMKTLGYPFEIVEKLAFMAMEPALVDAPEAALFYPSEGAVDGPAMARAMLASAEARVMSGVRVAAIEEAAGRVTGVTLSAGRIPADAVVVAAGMGAPALLAPLGVPLPMMRRPGLLLRTRPVAPVIGHILASPRQELRQDAAGRILAPTAASHQCDDTETVVERPDALADQALARLRRMLPGIALDWEEVVLAERPVPGDGRPVMGPVKAAGGPEGLYLAVMHSGATLAALAGELAAQEIVAGDDAALLAPYRVERFARGGDLAPDGGRPGRAGIPV